MANTWILIRHPDKEGDKEGVYLGNTAEITELGRQQMHLVAARLKLLCPDVITCSQLPRAVTLAKHLATELRLGDPVQTGLLNEIDKPQFLIGKKRTARLHERTMRAIRKGWDTNTVPTHLLRGEKIRSRSQVERDLKRLFRMVEDFQPSGHTPVADIVLSVTHAKLIAAIGHYIYRGDRKLIGYYSQADRALEISTTGITILRRKPNRRTGKIEWRITTWNEESHTEIGFDEKFRELLKTVT